MCAARMHADEIDTDVPLVHRLIAAQFPQWAELDVTPVTSSGTDNAMYRLGDDLAVRLPRIASAAGNIEQEQRWLPQLAPLLPVTVPMPIGRGEPDEHYPLPWSVVRWLDGANPVVGEILEPTRLAEDLAAFITALRQIDVTDAPQANRGGPLAGRDAATRKAIAELDGMIDTELATTVWDDALRLTGRSAPAWAHGDLSPGNVLVSGGRLSAVIDFSGVGVGDPTVDLVIAWNLLPARGRDALRTALEVDEQTWLRGRAWALSIALIQLPYYHQTNPGLAANSRHVINEVLGDN